MMQYEAVIALFPDLAGSELSRWIDRQWVQPERSEREGWVFYEIDVARIRLIYDLRRTFDMSEELLPIVLSLLDQVYDLRCDLKALTRAVESQPAEIRAAIQAALLTRPEAR